MIFYKGNWDFQIELNINKPKCFLFNNLDELYSFHKSLINTEETDIIITDGKKQLNLDLNTIYIDNILSLDLNTRKSITSLQKNISDTVSKSDLLFTFQQLKDEVNTFINKVKSMVLRNIVYDDFNFEELLKVMNVRLFSDYNKPEEMVLNFLELMIELTKVKVFFIHNVFHYFNETVIEEINKFCMINKIPIVYIEIKGSNKINRNLVDVYDIVDNIVLK